MTPEEFEPIVRGAMSRVIADGCIIEREITVVEHGAKKRCCGLGAFYFDDPARFSGSTVLDLDAQRLGMEMGLQRQQAYNFIIGFDSYASFTEEIEDPWIQLGACLAKEFCDVDRALVEAYLNDAK